jgi:uncharacterized membrane protein
MTDQPNSSERNAAAASAAEEARQAKMDVLVGYILLGGVLLSMALIIAGLAWRYINTGNLHFEYQITGMNLFQFAVSEARITLSGQLRPRLLLNMGIVILMLTPFLRVLTSVIYFSAVLKNWKYTAFTLFVLLVLTRSLFLR